MGKVIKGGLGVVDNVLGTNMGGPNATDKAIKAQRDATGSANATQRYMYDQTREDTQAWRDAGEKALGQLEAGEFAKDLQMDPGYQFRLDEANKAIERSAAARGGLNSGSTMKALSRFNQDYASQEYGNAYNREFNRLSQLAGLGGSGLQTQVGAGQNMANNISSNQMAMGNASAAANIAQANRQAGLIGQGIGAIAFCDRRVKENIKEVPESDLKELREIIKPYYYTYAVNEMGPGEWVGVMAQDLEQTKLGKTVVFENALGQKMVDQKKLLSLLIASFGKGAA